MSEPEHPRGLAAQLRQLASHSAVYGAADVFNSVVSLLLLPLFTAYLSAVEYGDLQLLIAFNAVAKIVFRLGLDAGFFRVYYDHRGREPRGYVGSIALAAALIGAVLWLVVLAASGPLTRLLLGDRPVRWLLLAAGDVALGTLIYVPLNLLRIQDRPGLFSAFSGCRHALNLGLKVVLVMAGYGVEGVLWSDLAATGAIALGLAPVLWRGASFAFDGSLVREALAFGLPKVPHGFLVQVQNVADKKLLDLFVPRAVVGQYGVAYALGSGVKFALSAFEPAWGPFVYSRIREDDAPRTLARVITWAWLAFALAATGVAALASELLDVFTSRPEFMVGAPVIPVVALAYLFHGVFLLTSIGIGVKKRTRWYPIITAVSATTNVVANLALIPRLGMMGSAWATVLSYGVMAGLGFWVGRGLYPLPLEWGRLGRITAAAALVFAASRLVPGGSLAVAIAVKGGLVATLPVLLLASGFATPGERAALGDLARRWRTPSRSKED